MAEGNASKVHQKLRSVFGDVTNQLGKRRSSDKEKDGIKSNNLKNEYRVKQARVLSRPCTEINSLKGNVISSISKVSNENTNTDALDLCKDSAVSKSVIQVDVVDNDISDCCNEIDSFKDSASSGIGKMGSENKMDPILTDLGGSRAVNHIEIVADVCDEIDSSRENVISGTPSTDSKKKCSSLVVTGRSRVAEIIVSDAGDGAMARSKISSKNENLNFIDRDKGKGLLGLNAEANDDLVDTFVTKILVPTTETGGNSDPDGKNCNEDKVSSEGTQSETDHPNYGDDNNVDSFTLSQSGSIDCNVLPESQESRVLGLERCTELKRGDRCANMGEGIDLIKACSCSFCTKAAYIWLDLHYQDNKARISALKKSQKEASIMAARSCWSKATEKHGLGNSTRVSNLEADLMQQWRYLFQHMVDTCEHESNELETNLLPLTELREQCKTDLKHINATSSKKH